MGETPLAKALKAVLRPIFKGLYYVIRAIRGHKLLSLVVLLLLVVSIFATSYFATGRLPFSGSNQSQVQNANGSSVPVPDSVQNWLMALRAGNSEALLAAQKDMPASVAKPDIAMALLRFSESQSNKWTAVKLIGLSSPSDGSKDIFIEIDMTQQTSGGPQNIVVLWHFTTIMLPPPKGEIIYNIDYISERPSFK